MRIFNKVTAAILAIVTTTAVASSIATTFAYDGFSSSQNNFINSFTDEDLKECAEYLFRHGFTIEDAERILGIHESDVLSTNAEMNEDFYNPDYCLDVPHFAVIINHAPRFTLGNTMVTLSANSSYVNQFIGHGVSFPYIDHVGSYSTDSYVENDMVYCDETYRRVSAITNNNTAQVIGKVFVDVNHENVSSEADLYNRVSMNYTISTTNSTLSFEIFARGDVSHNGRINAVDASILLSYLTKVENGDPDPDSVLNFNYLDGDNHCSIAVNKIACDVDLDNDIDNNDLVILNKYLAGIIVF